MMHRDFAAKAAVPGQIRPQPAPFPQRIQADIFDHILAIAREFDLCVYQNPSGSDFQELAARTSYGAKT